MRLILPAARSVLRYDAVTPVPDATEDTSQQARQLAPDDLPDDVLIHLLPSRFCLPGLLGSKAWSRFEAIPAEYDRVQAISGYVHAHVTFSSGGSNPWTTATDVNVSRHVLESMSVSATENRPSHGAPCGPHPAQAVMA